MVSKLRQRVPSFARVRRGYGPRPDHLLSKGERFGAFVMAVVGMVGAALFFLAVIAAIVAIKGAALMLAVAAVRQWWVPDVPPLGFWPACIIASLLTLALYGVSGKRTGKRR